MSLPRAPAASPPPRHPLRWVALLYFAQGLPFGIINTLFMQYLTFHNVSLSAQGFSRLLQLPWALKVTWSPWVDRLGTPQRWIVAALGFLGAALGVAAVAEGGGHLQWGSAMAAMLLLMAFASATQDIAIDGYFVRLLSSSAAQAAGNSLRISIFRVAMIVGGGGALVAVAWLSYATIFAVLGLLCWGLALAISRAPHVARGRSPGWKEWALSLRRWAGQPHAVQAFAFLMLYKLGDAALGPMIAPFWKFNGMSAAEVGVANISFGALATVGGAMVGGAIAARVGVFAALWQLGLAQAMSNLGYVGAAAWGTSRASLVVISLLENFCGGMGTAAELLLLTRLCDREHAGTQFAALTSMFAVTRTLAGAFSGMGAQSMGYAPYFLLTFFLSFLSFLFLPGVRRRLAATVQAQT